MRMNLKLRKQMYYFISEFIAIIEIEELTLIHFLSGLEPNGRTIKDLPLVS